ncbi:hypothetical protein, partial [Salmonella sp. s51228]|uniref:hypothetical protein n=1 Tax=Salmonella sp. s51228 TaxID=3159652 RepID=UPI00397F861F
VKSTIMLSQTTNNRSSNGRAAKKTKPFPHTPLLSKKKEYSSYGLGLAEANGEILDAVHNTPVIKYKTRNGGIPVFSQERVVERLTKKKVLPQS